jgi:hypothetical protein
MIKLIKFNSLALQINFEVLAIGDEILCDSMDFSATRQGYSKVREIAIKMALAQKQPLYESSIEDAHICYGDGSIPLSWLHIHDVDFSSEMVLHLADDVGYAECFYEKGRSPSLSEDELVDELNSSSVVGEYVLWSNQDLAVALLNEGYADSPENIESVVRTIREVVEPQELQELAIQQAIRQLRYHLLPAVESLDLAA